MFTVLTVDDFDARAFLSGIILQQKLFEHVEGLPLLGLLPDLHRGRPRVLGLNSAAVIAHLVVHHVFNDEGLLKNGPARLRHFGLH